MSLTSQYLTSEDLLECEEPFRSPLQNATQGGSLNNLLEEMRSVENGLPIQTHRLRLRNHVNCFLGTQLVDWLLSHNRSSSMSEIFFENFIHCFNKTSVDFRAEAIGVGQALLDGGHIDCASQPNDAVFHDGNALYRLSRDSEILFRSRSDSMKGA